MFYPDLKLSQLLAPELQQLNLVETPPEWESEEEKYLKVTLLPGAALDEVDLFQAFISNNWNNVHQSRRLTPFPRDNYDCFLEAGQLTPEVMMTHPPMTMMHGQTVGWLVMSMDVPGLLSFSRPAMVDYQRKLFGMLKEPENEEEEKAQQVPTFLFGTFIPIPYALLTYIDPKNQYFKQARDRIQDPHELIINFAKFHHEELPDEE